MDEEDHPDTPQLLLRAAPQPAAMDLASTDLAALGAAELVGISASIPRAAPRTFALLTACLVFPLSFAVLVHFLFLRPHPILVAPVFVYKKKNLGLGPPT